MTILAEIEPQQKPTSESGDSLLGTIAKFASAPKSPLSDALVMRFYLQTLARELIPTEKVAKCLRWIIPGQSQVDVLADLQKHRAHFGNLITCSRVWLCPVCASKITEARAEELTRASAAWLNQDGFVAMVTFTLSHREHQPLSAILNTLREAHRRFKSGRAFQTMQANYGWRGSVAALEVTHGENGWHPHVHELVFFDAMWIDSFAQFERDAKKRWIDMLKAFSWSANYEYALDVRTGDDTVTRYVAKYGKMPEKPSWSIEREVAKSPTKRATEGGRTPFQLLLDYGEGDTHAGELFQEYAREFKGRRQLVWSRGLRTMLQLGDEIADAEIAELLPKELEILASISKDAWKWLMRQPRDVRADILAIAGTGDKARLSAYLESLGLMP